MCEQKKTFKNPAGTHWGYSDRWITPLSNNDGESHLKSEWDMEVTFTKRPKPFVPGHYRRGAIPTQNRAEVGVFYWEHGFPYWEPSPERWTRVNVTDAE